MASDEYTRSRLASILHDYSLRVVDWVYNDDTEDRREQLKAATNEAVDKIMEMKGEAICK